MTMLTLSRVFSSVHVITHGRQREAPLSVQRREKTGQQSSVGEPAALRKAIHLGASPHLRAVSLSPTPTSH